MLGFVNVSVKKGPATLLPQLSWMLTPGETLAIVGKSASGKSLILSMILGLVKPTEGQVEVDGVSLQILPPTVLQLYRQRLGVAFQDPRLLEHLSVLENVSLPLLLRGVTDDAAARTAMEYLMRAGLGDTASKKPESLSPGTQKLVALVRCLVTSPDIALVDEPCEHLDEAQCSVALHLLTEHRQAGRSLLLLTRDVSLAQEMGARILKLESGSMEAPAEPLTASAPVANQTAPANDDPKKVKITSIGA